MQRNWRVLLGMAAIAQGFSWLQGLFEIGEVFDYTAGTLFGAAIYQLVFVLVPLYFGALTLGEERGRRASA